MTQTRIALRVNTPRSAVYRALLDAGAVATWMVPDGMTEREGATDIVAVHDRLPPGLSPAENEVGWRSSLGKLQRLVEAS